MNMWGSICVGCVVHQTRSEHVPTTTMQQVGTLTYMAPEVLVNRDGKYDGKVRMGRTAGHSLVMAARSSWAHCMASSAWLA